MIGWRWAAPMKAFDHRDAEPATAAVGVACRRFLQEGRRVAWQVLWIGSGLWLGAALCTEKFVVDLAETLERRRESQPEGVRAGRWDGRVTDAVWHNLMRVARWCEPRASACRRLATRVDGALIQRCGLDNQRSVLARC